MHDRIPGAPGQYKAVIAAEQLLKMQSGEQFVITMTRDDHPSMEGTPYNKASVLPDDVALLICPSIADPTPADAFRALAKGKTSQPIILVEGIHYGDIFPEDAVVGQLFHVRVATNG